MFQKGHGYEDLFMISALMLLASTALNSNVSIILRHLRKINVISLNASREIIFVMITFVIIFAADIQLYSPNLEEKLKLSFFGMQIFEQENCDDTFLISF